MQGTDLTIEPTIEETTEQSTEQNVEQTIEQQLHRAMRAALAGHPALTEDGGDPSGAQCAGPAERPAEDGSAGERAAGEVPAIVHVQVRGPWVCVSRLVHRVSCCREQLPWSAGWVVRRFDDAAARPVGIEDRRHSCGRTPDAVDVTDRFHPGEETAEQFCARLAGELAEAFRAATARTRAGHRGAAVAVDRRKAAPAIVRRDFHLRTLDL